LKHYFISSVNLLQGIPDDLANSATDAIQQVFDNKLVTGQLQNHFCSMKTLLDAMNDQKNAMKSMDTGLHETFWRSVDPMSYYPSNPVVDWQSD